MRFYKQKQKTKQNYLFAFLVLELNRETCMVALSIFRDLQADKFFRLFNLLFVRANLSFSIAVTVTLNAKHDSCL